MSDLISENLNMIFKTPKGDTVHALKDVSFTLKTVSYTHLTLPTNREV